MKKMIDTGFSDKNKKKILARASCNKCGGRGYTGKIYPNGRRSETPDLIPCKCLMVTTLPVSWAIVGGR